MKNTRYFYSDMLGGIDQRDMKRLNEIKRWLNEPKHQAHLAPLIGFDEEDYEDLGDVLMEIDEEAAVLFDELSEDMANMDKDRKQLWFSFIKGAK